MITFIVDAQLPRRLAYWMRDKGYDVVHTLDLEEQNQTEDLKIIQLSMAEKRVVVTKDSDFYDQFILKGEPFKLLNITTGNITNSQLINLFERNFAQICQLLENNQVVELSNHELIVHF
ncbi:DUF5615 family PIN-like protein [Pontibacter sp. G13]|uniref:DUF5615 family PIN-like protein n=1 Tax=Pontibacter sp. G13 TaxID=3074898 RepID=UPI00288B7E00|nr:DUF5615 family PIN-like protein [Pontibacter sp. G13]WNJ17650.1 DUF5615 family PIN-like protein [Pontibacter sp. G13]